MEQPDRVLKQDGAGRVWTPPERREALLDEFEKSGLPATQFAAHVGVKYPTFANWAQKRRAQRREAGPAQDQAPAIPRLAGWVEATVEQRPNRAAGVLVVQLPGGVCLEVADAAQALLAGQLLRSFGGGTGC